MFIGFEKDLQLFWTIGYLPLIDVVEFLLFQLCVVVLKTRTLNLGPGAFCFQLHLYLICYPYPLSPFFSFKASNFLIIHLFFWSIFVLNLSCSRYFFCLIFLIIFHLILMGSSWNKREEMCVILAEFVTFSGFLGLVAVFFFFFFFSITCIWWFKLAMFEAKMLCEMY